MFCILLHSISNTHADLINPTLNYLCHALPIFVRLHVEYMVGLLGGFKFAVVNDRSMNIKIQNLPTKTQDSLKLCASWIFVPSHEKDLELKIQYKNML